MGTTRTTKDTTMGMEKNSVEMNLIFTEYKVLTIVST